jgi:hypothetical protein
MKRIMPYLLNLYSFLSNKYFLILVYLFLTSITAFNHELWRDEADVWLFARDTNFTGFFEYLSNSGHPGLWHLLLLPFAKLNFPNYTIQILHLSIAVASIYLLLSYSNFPKYIQILLVFNYYLLYEYAIVCRNYSIGVFLMFAIAALYPKRFERPILYGFLIFLLCNTNLYCSIISSGIALIYFLEMIQEKKLSKSILLGFCLTLVGAIVLLVQVFPNPESGEHKEIFASMRNSMAVPISIIYSFSPGALKINYQILPGFIIICLSLVVFFRTKIVFIFFVWSLSFLFLFYSFIYIRSYRHAGFVLFSFLFAYWIQAYYRSEENAFKEFAFKSIKEYLRKPLVLLNLFFVLSLLTSTKFAFQELRKDILFSYSNAKEMAEFMVANKYDSNKNTIVAHGADSGKTVLFYLKNTKEFYYPGIDSFGSYIHWDRKAWNSEKMKMEEAFLIAKEKLKDRSDTLFLTGTPLSDTGKASELLYQTSKRNEFIKEEEYYLYRLNP